ncbi:MAG: DUF932 domain-containing protein [Synergistaceae bacterium]|nr:DUF932 domain-containing protein [Synergistaceae bacterium]
MKQGKSLPEVLAELQRQNGLKRDYIAPATAFKLENDGETFVLSHNDGKCENFDMTDLFHRQIGSTLEIPAKYYDAMRKQKPELLAQNVNAWFGDREQSYMVRSMSYEVNPEHEQHENAEGTTGTANIRKTAGVARALLSDRYRRIDNTEIAAAVLPLFAGQDGMEVASSAVTPTRMYLKILNHRLEQEVVPGDIVQAGVVISNSEVGLGAVSVQPLVYRLVCSNGLIVNDFGERKTHIGRTVETVEDTFHIYSSETLEAENKAFMLKIRDATLAAIEETRFAMIVDKLRDSTEAKITGHVSDVVELTSKAYGLNQGEQESILDYLIAGGDLSLYGLSNAVTRASQDVESYDRATTLESIGWQVVTMSPSQWREMNR